QNLRFRLNQRKEARTENPPPEIAALGISVELKSRLGDVFWLNSISVVPGRTNGAGLRVLLVGLGLSLATVLGFGLIFVRQLVGPISDLAKAANAAANGDRSARVPLSGAREFKQAGMAFNDMQTRIAQFDAERMRTLAAVGHDLRTPITSLRIRAEMLDDGDARQAFIRTLDDMTVMADGLVQFAKSGHENEAKQAIDLAQLLARLCGERGATLQIIEKATVQAGPVAMSRAIGNLIDNAMRYGGNARVTLSIETERAQITVEDDGPGIAPEKIEALFEPFVRGDNSRNAETGGTGLGLSIARAIILSSGGTIKLENKFPNGLRATVSLPSQNNL
ncbi:MAG: ATP-binding protein, partial [Notoacmeibacter sp.]